MKQLLNKLLMKLIYRRWYISLVVIVTSGMSLFAQQKGVSPIPTSDQDAFEGTCRAVVVGISDYQNPDIPDLKYAHKDAQAFVKFMQSPSGGSLDEGHMQVLLNEQATTASIAAALDWLMEESMEGDRAIIYFSGHGDVETKTMFQLGYLLTWDSPQEAIWQAHCLFII